MATCLLLLIGKQTDCLDGHLYGIKGCYVLPDFYKYLYSFPEKDPVTSSPLWSILFLLWGQVHLFHIQHKEDTGKIEPFIYTPYMVRLSDLMGNFREQVKKEKLFTASHHTSHSYGTSCCQTVKLASRISQGTCLSRKGILSSVSKDYREICSRTELLAEGIKLQGTLFLQVTTESRLTAVPISCRTTEQTWYLVKRKPLTPRPAILQPQTSLTFTSKESLLRNDRGLSDATDLPFTKSHRLGSRETAQVCSDSAGVP